MRANARLVRWAVEQLPRLWRGGGVGHLDVVAGLDGPEALAQLVLGYEKAITDAQLGTLLPGEQALRRGHVDDGVLGHALGLAVEEVGDGGDGIELKLLVGVELELHLSGSITPS